MRIIKLEAENLKRLRAVSITPAGNVVQITGPNGSGKSSVIDAIFWALTGAKNVTSEPIRRGEESARIVLDLGELIVTRRFNGAGQSLVVEAPSGAMFSSPQRLLDSLLGALTFDPLEFARANPKAQLETLRKLVPLAVDVDALDGLNKKDYDARTEWNRRVDAFTVRVETAREGVDALMDVTPVDESALLDQMQGALDHNNRVRVENTNRADARQEIEQAKQRARECREQAEELLRNADAAEQVARAKQQALNALEADEPVPNIVDVGELRAKVEAARTENQRREMQRLKREQHAAAVRELTEAKEKADALTAAIAERTEQKRTAIASAKMPVDGLSFGDGMVLYKGLPFDQASSAEQLRVSVGLAMAANPKLRILRIQDGSLLDEHSIEAISQMADANDYQVWIEVVDTSGRVGIVMHDGEVVAVNNDSVVSAA